MKVLVTGANGQVGSELQELQSRYSGLTVVFYEHSQFDITDAERAATVWQNEAPDVCINCAAYTAVDQAEEEPEIAHKINAAAVENLAALCKEHNTFFIHFSTDYVFDGSANIPYQEGDVPMPAGVYGKSKLEGERAALQQQPSTILIRTSWVYSSFGHNLVKTALRLAQERDHLAFVYDQAGAPTYARDLAAAVLQIIDDGSFQEKAGLYHFSNPGVTSWYDIVNTIIREKALNCTLTPILSKDYPTPAKRPHYSVFNTEKFRNTFNQRIPHWQESLLECLSKLNV